MSFSSFQPCREVGSLRQLDPGQSVGRSRSGFTLVEILLVVSILIGLAAIVVVSGGVYMSSTKVRGTKALLEKIRLQLEEYKSITGYYPPDGLDSVVKNEEGERLRGSAALYHALTSPIEATMMAGGIPRVVRRDEPLGEFASAELSDENDEFPGVREILDPFGLPIHYDNTLDGRFRPQRGEVHYPPIDDEEHPEDPRSLEESEGGVEKPGEVQSRGYDLWSFGERGHDPEDKTPPIASWNLNE